MLRVRAPLRRAALPELLHDSSPRVRAAVLEEHAAGRIALALDDLVPPLADPDPAVRSAAIGCLTTIVDPPRAISLHLAQAFAREHDVDVRGHALRSLSRSAVRDVVAATAGESSSQTSTVLELLHDRFGPLLWDEVAGAASRPELEVAVAVLQGVAIPLPDESVERLGRVFSMALGSPGRIAEDVRSRSCAFLMSGLSPINVRRLRTADLDVLLLHLEEISMI